MATGISIASLSIVAVVIIVVATNLRFIKRYIIAG